MKKRLYTMAMYLPQFHRVSENEVWWGKGFTEWTTVKAAEKLYKGHNQPRVPLGNNYYDLLNKSTMEWQVALASEYGIDGFCFYHYYFKSGKKILEKPIENLLKWRDINISYCFCWANQTWARTWSNLWAANSWSDKFEIRDENTSPILLEQAYGNRTDWKKHIEYLIPFFLDKRYIKIDNKPVFLVYVPEDISELTAMIECWNDEVIRRGFDGIYVIGVNSIKLVPGLSARLLQGPKAFQHSTVAGMGTKNVWREGVQTFDYQECWDNAVNLEKPDLFRTYYGGFVDYDDTPRRGKAGLCAVGASPEKFEENLYKLAVKNIVLKNQWLFINAWNEWGESNYLEPDENNKYGYLEAVRNVMRKCNAEGLDAQREWSNIFPHGTRPNGITEIVKETNKYREFYKVLNNWLTLKEQGLKLEKYFMNCGYRRVLIYGMAELGKHLYEELRQSSLEVVGALDRRSGIVYKDIKFYEADGEIPECDIIVVTAISDYETIRSTLVKRTEANIISLKDIINYML